MNLGISHFTEEELAELAEYDAKIADEPDYDAQEVIAARKRDRKFLDDRLDPKQLKKRQSYRKYYRANKERIDARNRAYADAHAEEIRDYRREYYRDHAEDILARRKAYAEANRESISEYQHNYHQAHKDEHNAYSRQYRADHLESERERGKRWREQNKERIKAYRKANRERDNAKARERYAAKKAKQEAAV